MAINFNINLNQAHLMRFGFCCFFKNFGEFGKIFFKHCHNASGAQGGGGVKHRYYKYLPTTKLYYMGLSMYSCDFNSGQEFTHGKAAQSNNNLGVNNIYYPIEIFSISFYLNRLRVAVFGRPVMDNIGNINFFSGQFNRLK